jgi:hypothetical protein
MRKREPFFTFEMINPADELVPSGANSPARTSLCFRPPAATLNQ